MKLTQIPISVPLAQINLVNTHTVVPTITVDSIPAASAIDSTITDTIDVLDSFSQSPSIILGLPIEGFEDFILYDVGAINLHALASTPEVHISHLIKDATLLTTSLELVEGEGKTWTKR